MCQTQGSISSPLANEADMLLTKLPCLMVLHGHHGISRNQDGFIICGIFFFFFFFCIRWLSYSVVFINIDEYIIKQVIDSFIYYYYISFNLVANLVV